MYGSVLPEHLEYFHLNFRLEARVFSFEIPVKTNKIGSCCDLKRKGFGLSLVMLIVLCFSVFDDLKCAVSVQELNIDCLEIIEFW